MTTNNRLSKLGTLAHGQVEEPLGPVLEPRVLANLRRLQIPGEPDFLADLVTRFLNDTPNRVLAIQAAIEQEDARSLQQTAHLLRGNSANIGAARLSKLCRELDELGRSGTTEGAWPYLQAIEAEYAVVTEALLAEIGRD